MIEPSIWQNKMHFKKTSYYIIDKVLMKIRYSPVTVEQVYPRGYGYNEQKYWPGNNEFAQLAPSARNDAKEADNNCDMKQSRYAFGHKSAGRGQIEQT